MHRLFFTLLVIFLPVQLGYHFWPEWSMVLGRRVDYLSPTLFFTDILVLLTLGFWIASEGLGRLGKLGRLGIIFVFLFAAGNILFAASRPAAIYHWATFVKFGLLGWYIVKTRPNIAFVSSLLSLSVLYSSLIAVGQFWLQRSIGGPLWFLGERTFAVDTPGIARAVIGGREMLRAYGTFPHPNVLGGYLATVLPLLISEHTNKRISELTKKMYAITIVLGSMALIATFSRSAWAVFLLMMGVRKKIFWVLLPLLFVVPLSWAEESFAVRNELNIAALRTWKSAPVLGVGLGNFLIALPQYLPSRTIYFLQPVHNIYLLMLAEIGVVGVVGVIGVIGVMRKRIRFTLPLAALLLLGLADHYPLTLQQGQLLLTIVMALSYRARR